VLMHRLVRGLTEFEIRVVTLSAPGAARFDAGGEISVRRVRAPVWLGGGRMALLNARSMLEALQFRPDVTLSGHIVTSPAAWVIRRALGDRTVQYFYAKEIGARPRLSAFAARHADEAIVISAYASSLIEATGPIRAAPTLIPPGVDIPADTDPLPAEHPTLLTIARLEDRYKGHDVVIRALPLVRAKVPDVRWIVIGDGPLRAGLEQHAGACGVLDSVRFLGAVSDEERNEWLRRTNVLVMPSRLPAGDFAGEGFGIVYLEAGIYGKPVVAGNVAGALDSVADSETGLLVDPTDHVDVADAITRLLLDRELARRLGDAGAERAQSFAWPVICARVEAVLFKQLEASTVA